MGRYSFFILSFCYRGNYVYADSSSSDVLLDSSSDVDNSSSDSIVDSETSTLDSSSSVQQEESTSTSVSEESSEEGVQDSLDKNYEYYDLSNPFVFGNTDNGEDSTVDLNIMPRMFTTFASGGPSTVYAGPNNGWNITGYFTSWRLDGTLNATMIANNIDMIVNQARNSFSFVNSRLNGLENWRSSASNSISSLNSSVSSQRTQISNAFSRIAANENNIDALISSRNSHANRLSSLESGYTGVSNNVSALITRMNSAESAISGNSNNISAIIKRLNTAESDISGSKNNIQALITRMNSAESAISGNSNNIQALITRVNRTEDGIAGNSNNIQALIGRMNTVESVLTANEGYFSSMNAHLGKIRENTNILPNLEGYLKSMNTHLSNISEKSFSIDSAVVSVPGFEGFFKSMNGHLSNISSYTKPLESFSGYFLSMNAHLGSIKDSLNGGSVLFPSAIGEIRDFTNLIFLGVQSISGFDGYLKHLGTIKDNTASLLNFEGYYKSMNLHLGNINEAINSLKTNIQAQFDLYFTDGGFFWKAYDERFNQLGTYFDMIYNMDNKDSMLYRLIYFFIDEMTKTRDFVIEINDNLLIANDSILIIIDWLRMIYSKPPSNVNVVVPSFDFDRLQQMLDGLNFGNIVNEAGTNIWDFLSQLIKTLGEIISTAITGLTDVVGEILDLLGDLINQIIKLIVPENLDFLDTGFGTVKSKIDIKFGSFLSLGNQVKEVVQPIDQDFKKVVSIDIMGAKFNPDFSTIDWVVVRFRTVMALSIWMSVAIYIYRKITGNGDLINDN
ncbi:hypothetical protein [Enterococcus innesii]|uniref:hypothetical protein n=1 Tax=Enterococcus innesii TaxID=2839759 RepID=UPI00206AAAD6|nr:hypothetical protein [Enterococcus innesii]DAJ02299.1 MAG TPA: Tail needle protein [Inoviridae sp.]